MIRSHHVCQSAVLWRRLFRSPRLVVGSLWFFQSAHSHCRFHSLIKDSPHVFFCRCSLNPTCEAQLSHTILFTDVSTTFSSSMVIVSKYIYDIFCHSQFIRFLNKGGFGVFFLLLWTEIIVIYLNKFDLNIQRRENDDKDFKRQRFRQTNNEKKSE